MEKLKKNCKKLPDLDFGFEGSVILLTWVPRRTSHFDDPSNSRISQPRQRTIFSPVTRPMYNNSVYTSYARGGVTKEARLHARDRRAPANQNKPRVTVERIVTTLNDSSASCHGVFLLN
jgi:hypothetical protein